MSSQPFRPAATDTIDAAASQWLARRDRGLSAVEQDAYLQWLRDDPRHAVAIQRHEKAWGALDGLSQWRPAHSPQPNPDLLAPPRRRARRWTGVWLAAAAVLALTAMWWGLPVEGTRGGRTVIHPGAEKRVLDDGSIVELNTGARIEVDFTPEVRQVRLLQGEAHFTVAKNPARPFTVTAEHYTVRAVGTAFSVSLAREAVAVLVTEGTVSLGQASPAEAGAKEFSRLVAGQQAVISTAPAPVVPVAEPAAEPMQAGPAEPSRSPVAPQWRVREVTPAEIDRALAWQNLRLEFIEMPLGEVVTEFNRYNRRRLVVTDAATSAILVGGNFRADNIDAFVRLAESTLGLTVSQRGEEILLGRTP